MPTITGTLTDPLGSAIAGANIRITSDTTSTTLYGLKGSVTTGSNGSYSFVLNDGTYLIEVLFMDEYIRAAVVQVDNTVPTSLDLEKLITDHATFIPNQIDA